MPVAALRGQGLGNQTRSRDLGSFIRHLAIPGSAKKERALSFSIDNAESSSNEGIKSTNLLLVNNNEKCHRTILG